MIMIYDQETDYFKDDIVESAEKIGQHWLTDQDLIHEMCDDVGPSTKVVDEVENW